MPLRSMRATIHPRHAPGRASGETVDDAEFDGRADGCESNRAGVVCDKRTRELREIELAADGGGGQSRGSWRRF